MSSLLSRRVLSKEDEASSTDAEVTREDQDKINRFSSLHNRIRNLDEQLAVKKKDKEDLEEVTQELELVLDEEEPVRYKVGSTFYSVPLSEAQTMLQEATSDADSEIEKLEDEVGVVKEEMDKLKAELYARFGRGINLEA
ncbi:Prefoldin subunit 4 [Cyphellophora attinorum]|uniref:Prefoldin subunit 4 n=1 Tax=Cyphellophora attinorum TaxID=1664694 RepID=A0A0N0NN80_9EURO|nr:Prefoldin subunit 4 [Phialophora attinorum]KPI41208.1 Prefoldin subunit 4 [Phialophora attinorum]